MKKHEAAAILLSLLPFIILIPLAMAQDLIPTIRLTGPDKVGEGTPFAVNVEVEDARGIGGWEADIHYDHNTLDYGGTTHGTYIQTPPTVLPLLDETKEGIITTGQFTMRPGSGIVASLTFTGTEPGMRWISISNAKLTTIDATPYPSPITEGILIQIGETPTPTPTITPTSTPTPICLCTYWDGRTTPCSESQ